AFAVAGQFHLEIVRREIWMSFSVSQQGAVAPSLHSRLHLGVAESLISRITAHATIGPNRAAIVDGPNQLSFGQLEQRSNALASYLREHLHTEQSCVALLMDRSADFVVAALAVLKSGAAYLPLDASTPADRIAFVVRDSGAPMLLTHRSKASALSTQSTSIIDLNELKFSECSTLSTDFEPTSDSLAYVIYTSGS